MISADDTSDGVGGREESPSVAGGDAYSPPQIAARIEKLGVAKVHGSGWTMFVLATLAGAFISMGAILYLVAITDTQMGFGPTRLLGGLAFSLGLILVVVAGAELFTGNNLIAMAWASRRVTTRDVVRSWAIVYVGNVAGCVATVGLVWASDLAGLCGGGVGETAERVALGKAEMSVVVAFSRAILCNAMVCLAVWIAMGARSVAGKAVAIAFPIAAFVALGLEHSIANWFFLPYGMIQTGDLTLLGGAIQNLGVVTAGNIVGGTVLVAGVYWLAYRRLQRNPGG